MKITKLILITLFFNINIFAQDSCLELTQDECSLAPDCELSYDVAGQFESCIDTESDGPPDCILDCPGIEDIISDDPYQLCEWIISFNGTECIADCEEELLLSFEYMADACENCLSDTTIDCADIFEEGDDDNNGDDGDGPPECTLDCPGVFDIDSGNHDEICDWIISINGTECMEDCDQETMLSFEYLAEACYNCLSNDLINCSDIFEDNNGDDGGENIECSDINNPEECYDVGCEWSTVTTPNGIFEMCVEPGSGDDGGWQDGCFNFSQEECEWFDFCEWTDQGCVESGGWSDDGGWNENGCLADDGDWYCYGCEYFINDCEYYECTENGWIGPFENPGCNDNGDDGGEDDGPPECLLDCEGIEYVDPNEDAYETCDWIISNFGPNNFFAECAEDCDGETMELINQLVEACYECLSNENFDCADVFDDEDENSCSGLSQDDCEYLDYCEWIPDLETMEGQCVESDPGGDDGGTGGGDGCFENGEWYCYGCEMFINECEYYECTQDGWAGPFVIDDCWIEECYNLLQDECIGNPNCTWVWDNNPNQNDGYCMESDDNPPGDDLAVLKLEHTTALPGSTVSVPLILDNLETVGGLQFSIGGYNTPNFPGVSVEWFESTNDCFSASYNEVDEQLIGIIFSIEGCSYPPSEYNHIADILFYVDESAPVGVEVPLWFNYTLVSDNVGNEIPSHGEDSFITLGMQGDVNYDGEINILDIVTIVNFAIYAEEPTESQFWASDINNDGQINILDIVQLINIVLGD